MKFRLSFVPFLLILSVFPSTISSKNWQCTSQETAKDLAPCVRDYTIMTQLMDNYFNYKRKEDLDEIPKVCEKVKSCLATKKCVNLARIGDYIDLCDSFIFYHGMVPQCIEQFYGELKKKKSECAKEFDFFGNHLLDSLTRGKSCFLSIINSTCPAASYQFLASHYSEFLTMIKTDNGRGACRGLRGTILREPCKVIFGELAGMDTTTEHLENHKKEQEKAAEICRRGMKCMKDTCPDIETYYGSNPTYKMQCAIITKGNSKHWKCFEKAVDYEKFDCGKEVNELYNDQSVPSCVVKQKQADCLRFMIEKSCPGAKEEDYEDYNFVRNNDDDCPELKW